MSDKPSLSDAAEHIDETALQLELLRAERLSLLTDVDYAIRQLMLFRDHTRALDALARVRAALSR